MKYTTLAQLKAYGQVPATVTADDTTLTSAIERAEFEFDTISGGSFDQQTMTNARPIKAWVDQNGWIWAFAAERGPVTAVSAVTVRDLVTSPTNWQTVTWDAVNGILLPSFVDAYRPDPDWWTVRIYPTAPVLYPRDTRNFLVKWTYTAGFAVTPAPLVDLINRLAWWVYKLREAPMGKIVSPELGMMTIPLSIPPDIRADIMRWSRPV